MPRATQSGPGLGVCKKCGKKRTILTGGGTYENTLGFCSGPGTRDDPPPHARCVCKIKGGSPTAQPSRVSAFRNRQAPLARTQTFGEMQGLGERHFRRGKVEMLLTIGG